MPTYIYQCTACNDRFERFHRMTDPSIKECPECGGLVRKVMSPPAIAFKGPGFYVNDYKKAVPPPAVPGTPPEPPASTTPKPAPSAEKSAQPAAV